MSSLDEPVALHAMQPWRDRLAGFAARNLTGVRGLAVSGAGMGAIYLLLTLAFPITNWWYRVDDNLGTIPSRVPWAKPLIALFGAHQLSVVMAVITFGVIIALFSLQALAIFAARTSRDAVQAQRLVIGGAIAFIVIQVFMQPVTSTDLYGYLARSYLIATLHQNPTISLATFLPGGYLVPHARPPAPYGPLWLAICGGVGAVAGENLLLAMLLMKAIMAAAAIGTVLLVARLANRILPGQRVQALVLFAWSPLLIFEAVGNGHNDIVMMVCVLGSLAAIQAQRSLWAFPLLALGVLIKYSVGALVPLWAVYLFFTCCWRAGAALTLTWPLPAATRRAILARIDWRRTGVIFGGGGALSVLLAAVLYAPFWVGFKTFTGLGQQLGATYFNGSIAELLNAALQWTVAGGKAAALASAIRLTLYLAFAVYIGVQAWHLGQRGRAATPAQLVQAAGKVVFATLVLVTFWYQPWYIVWLLPLAALAPDAVLRRHAATLAFGGMLTYIVQYFAFVNQSELTRGFFVQFFLVIVAFAPLLLLQHGSNGDMRAAVSRYFSGLSAFVARHPTFISRLMLSLILCVAALLRLIKLGSAGQATSANALHLISGNLSVAVSDARGLDVVFVLLQGASVRLFGPTPFAILLPTALIGTATVWLIAVLANELCADMPPDRRQIVALLAAIIAATAPWHVALSRTGAEVTLLPLLIVAAALALWRAAQIQPPPIATPPETRATTRVRPYTPDGKGEISRGADIPVRRPQGQPATGVEPAIKIEPQQPMAQTAPAGSWRVVVARVLHPVDAGERRGRLLVLTGVYIGLIGDLEPDLWPLLGLLGLGLVALWWRRRLAGADALALGSGACVAGLPAVWYPLSRVVGFAPGSAFLAHNPLRHASASPLSLAFWGHILTNLGIVAQVLVTQNYDAAGPAGGNIPILPALLVPFFIVGAVITIRRWRTPTSALLALLAALPFVIALTVNAPPSVSEAAAVLPIACILPALGLADVGHWLATLPLVVAGPVNTVFISRRNMLRVALLLLVLIATVSTFFWYFASTIVPPTHIVRPA